MKKNLNVIFKSLDGRDIVENGKPIKISRLVAERLYYDQNVSDKLRASAMAIKLFSATEPVEMEKEDIEMIKEVCKKPVAAGLYAQIVKALDVNE